MIDTLVFGNSLYRTANRMTVSARLATTNTICQAWPDSVVSHGATLSGILFAADLTLVTNAVNKAEDANKAQTRLITAMFTARPCRNDRG
jgi:hypothetical protein